jgi:hypothetical protein
MSLNFKNAYLLLIAVFLMTCSCNTTSYDAVYPTLSDGKYDSEFPYRNCSAQLEEIAGSLVKMNVLVFYNTYSFSPEPGMSLTGIRKADNLEETASSVNVFSESVSGTAIIIDISGQKAAYLSCAHIVDYPDTVISYYEAPFDNIVQAVAIKARQQNSVSTRLMSGDPEILAIDTENDIAILGSTFEGSYPDGLGAFKFPMGRSEELEWGSFVYIMGYPLGNAMITRAIVSDPGRIRKGSFLIDAVFNRGFSGSPVIAVRDGVPNFEIVGMVKSSAAEQKQYLIPEIDNEPGRISLDENYEGNIRVSTENEIRYGITYSITTDALRSFYRNHRKDLLERGYNLDRFFGFGPE